MTSNVHAYDPTKEGIDWVQRYMPPQDIGVRYLLSDNIIVLEVVDRELFHRYLSTLNDKTPFPLESVRPRYVLRDLQKRQERTSTMRDKAIRAQPDLRTLVEATPVYSTFSPLFNAGAGPVPGGGSCIKLNDGIEHFSYFIRARREVDDKHPANWERRFEQLRAYSDKPAFVSREEHDKMLLSICPRPPRDEFVAALYSTFLLALECMGLRLPSARLLLSRTQLVSRPPLIIGTLGTNEFLGDTLTTDVIEPFIYFHELGHIALGHTEFLRNYRADPSLCSSVEEYYETRHTQEFDADRFAVELLMKVELDFDILRFALISLFTLFLLCELRIDLLPESIRRRLLASTSARSDYDGLIRSIMPVIHRSHPPSLTRFARIWNYLGEHQPPQPENPVDVVNLKREEFTKLAMMGDISKYMSHDTHVPTEKMCESMLGFARLCADAILIVSRA